MRAFTLLTWSLITWRSLIEHQLERLYSLDDPQFMRDMSLLLGPPITQGNAVDVLLNGDQIFPAMLAAIRAAQCSITFETFIYWSGSIGAEFSEALGERARAGVSVHVLLDWLGSLRADDDNLERMRFAGVEVERYHQPHGPHMLRVNNRTHRKVLVVDGQIGFTGGVGIADQWLGNAQDEDHWRDTHFRLQGPAVGQLQAVFTDNWMKANGRVLRGASYFPELEHRGGLSAQMFMSSLGGGSESMQLMFLMIITAASTSIDLASAYFVPDEITIKALTTAVERGVKIRIIVPGEHIDATVVRRASRASWEPLLEAGIVIAEYQPTMYHCKVLIADRLVVSVGSTNFDNRSFRLNDEANLNVFDAQLAMDLTRQFEADLELAHQITLEEWRKRPLAEKMLEHSAALLGSQL